MMNDWGVKMKVSSKGRYGLRCMLDLALHAKGEHVALHQLAERQGLSLLYLEQVFSSLRKAGLVKSVKGAGGGYSLATSARSISVGDVIRAVEGDTSIVKTSDYGKNGDANSLELCIRSLVWQRIDDRVNDLVDSISLEELADETQKHLSSEALMFYI
jgi:Rrf2 family cysteine metabolism transcriptional repressor